jgi:hypothetical protein
LPAATKENRPTDTLPSRQPTTKTSDDELSSTAQSPSISPAPLEPVCPAPTAVSFEPPASDQNKESAAPSKNGEKSHHHSFSTKSPQPSLFAKKRTRFQAPVRGGHTTHPALHTPASWGHLVLASGKCRLPRPSPHSRRVIETRGHPKPATLSQAPEQPRALTLTPRSQGVTSPPPTVDTPAQRSRH